MRALRLVADQKEGPDAALARGPPRPAAARRTGLRRGHDRRRLLADRDRDRRPPAARPPARARHRLRAAGDRGRATTCWCSAAGIPADDAGAGRLRDPPAAGDRAWTVIPDALLVPLLAVDRRGHRLGYGRGWYDRTLAALRGGGASVGRDRRRLWRAARSSAYRAAADDEPVDWILTERVARAPIVTSRVRAALLRRRRRPRRPAGGLRPHAATAPAPRTRLRHRQRRERRARLRHHPGDLPRVLRRRRRRRHHRQPRLGPARDHRLHRRRRPPAAAAELSRKERPGCGANVYAVNGGARG